MAVHKNPQKRISRKNAVPKTPRLKNTASPEDEYLAPPSLDAPSPTTEASSNVNRVLQLQRLLGNQYVSSHLAQHGLQRRSNPVSGFINRQAAQPPSQSQAMMDSLQPLLSPSTAPTSDKSPIQRKLAFTTANLETAKITQGGFSYAKDLYNAVRDYHQNFKEDVATQTTLLDTITEKGQQFLTKEDETLKKNSWMKEDYTARTDAVKKLLQIVETERRNIRVTAKKGGMTGLVLDVTYAVSDTKADGLQVIQVWWGNKSTLGQGVGKNNFEQDGKQYESFVDGGMNSPFVTLSGEQPAHPTKPYYLTVNEVKSNVKWDSGKKAGTVQIYDQPTASVYFDEMNFETAIVAINYNGSGKDRVMQVFTWGFTKQGTKAMHDKGDEIEGKPSGVKTTGSVSPTFRKIVANDYSGYQYD